MNVRYFLDSFAPLHEGRLQDCRREARGRLSGDELLSEAFLIAHELGEQHGRTLDLRDPLDAELLLSGLLRRARQLGRYRRGLSLDAAVDGGEEEASLAFIDLARGPEAWEPFMALLSQDELPEDAFARLQAGYSQAAAYLILLERHGWCAEALAQAFRIGAAVLLGRFKSANAWLCRQPSIFDGVEQLPADFLAGYGRQRPARAAAATWGEQQSLL